MNYRVICFAIGRILLVEAALLLLPMAVGVGYGESPVPFLIPIALLVLCGGLLSFKKPKQMALYARDGMAVVALATVLIAWDLDPVYHQGALESLRYAFFHVTSVISTSGFFPEDYALWPQFSQMVLVLLMFSGSCSSSNNILAAANRSAARASGSPQMASRQDSAISRTGFFCSSMGISLLSP